MAKFYTKIVSDNDLIERLDGIALNLVEISDKAALDRYKDYINRDAQAIVDNIKEQVCHGIIPLVLD